MRALIVAACLMVGGCALPGRGAMPARDVCSVDRILGPRCMETPPGPGAVLMEEPI